MRPRRSRGRVWKVLVAFAFGVGGLSVVALVHRTVDVIRGAPITSVSDGGNALYTSDPGFPAHAAALAETAIVAGHEVEVLLDHDVFGRMFADLAAARVSVTFLGYYCGRGEVGTRLAEVLRERARAGVRVFFLGDAFGCADLLDELRGPLQGAGASVASFRPVHWYSLHRAQHRMHARSVVIDGAVGYTGGFGVDDKWLSDRPGEPMWRETSVRFAGPAVVAMQATFLAAWAEATGELVTGDEFFPSLNAPVGAAEPDSASLAVAEAAGVRAGLLYSRLGIGPTRAERYYAVTIASAERTLFVTNSYFVPTSGQRRLLAEAARRGVDVRVLVPGARIDIPSTRWAGRGYYDELLAAGVRIWEYQPAMMHAKTVVSDGVWVSIGSLNFDNRSTRLNDESALLVFDRSVGERMDSIFLADLEHAFEITLPAHARRPWWEKLLELGTRLIAPLL